MRNLSFDKKQALYEQFALRLTQARRTLLEQVARNRTRYITVVLEDLYQPHNMSAVLRSADCFGVQQVAVIEERNEFSVEPSIAKGAAQWLDITKHSSTHHAFESLRSHGYKIACATPHTDDMLISHVPLEDKIALVFGTEYRGLSDYALSHADYYVKVPMHGFTESFNISVAAAICLYDVITRLQTSPYAWQLTDEERLDVLLAWLTTTTAFGDEVAQALTAQGLVVGSP